MNVQLCPVCKTLILTFMGRSCRCGLVQSVELVNLLEKPKP